MIFTFSQPFPRGHLQLHWKPSRPAPLLNSRYASLSAILFLLFFGVSVQAQWWKVQTSGLDTNLRGVSAAYTPGEKRRARTGRLGSGSNA